MAAMNWYVPLLVTGLFLAFSATVFLVSLAISHKMLAGNADYQKQRRFLLVMWAGFTFFTLVDMGIDRLYGKPVSLVDLMIGFMGVVWGFALVFFGQRLAARLLGFQLPR